MIELPKHIAQLRPYKPGKSSDPSDFARYKAVLSSNENNYGPSPKAMDAVINHVGGIHLYPDPQGEKLTYRLAQKHDREMNEIVLSNGLDGLLYTIFQAFTIAGDEVVTNDNSFIAFNKFAKMNNLDLKIVPNRSYVFDLDRLVNEVSEKTKIVYLCNPNNPTGTHISREKLIQTLAHIPEHILVVVDEAYFDYARAIEPDFPDSTQLNFSNLLTLRTFSKLYGLAALRIGYGLARKPIIDALKQVKLIFNPNGLAQVAALACLDDMDHVGETLENNTKWIESVQNLLAQKSIRYIPSYANFVCTIHESKIEADRFFKHMDDNGILLRSLNGFGIPEGVRISIGNNEEMTHFAEILSRF